MNWTLFIAIITSIVSGIWAAYKYFEAKTREQNLKEFENYHRLIKELVEPGESNKMYIDRQTAIVFELRHFKRYYEFSYRTLKGLKQEWEKVPDQFPRLLEEIDLTLRFLQKRLN